MLDKSAPKLPVLVILHQEHSTAGRIGRLIQARGHALDLRRPRFGDDLPSTMANHAGAVIFGGPMSANDEEEFLRREIDWIGVPLKENKPFLGVCLGAQMLTRHFGGRVYKDPDGRAEIGYYDIKALPGAEALAGHLPDHVYQWHREGFDLPRGARMLARGEIFEVQACCIDRAYAIQFHPEVTYAMICRWTTRAADRMAAPAAQTREEHLEGWFRYDSAVESWAQDFVGRWLAA